jgi:hypothetical protein
MPATSIRRRTAQEDPELAEHMERKYYDQLKARFEPGR